MAHRFASLTTLNMKVSVASGRVRRAEDCNWRSILNLTMISQRYLRKESFIKGSLDDFWKRLILRKATVNSQKKLGLSTVRMVAVFFAAICMRGSLFPVFFLAMCFVFCSFLIKSNNFFSSFFDQNNRIKLGYTKAVIK